MSRIGVSEALGLGEQMPRDRAVLAQFRHVETLELLEICSTAMRPMTVGAHAADAIGAVGPAHRRARLGAVAGEVGQRHLSTGVRRAVDRGDQPACGRPV